MVDLVDNEEMEQEGGVVVPAAVYGAKTFDDIVKVISEWDWFRELERDYRDPEELSTDLHMSFGRWLRSFILNKGAMAYPVAMAPVYYDLYEKGLRHTDDMSAVIIEAAWHKVGNPHLPFNIEAHVWYYQNYWREAEEEQWKAVDSAVDRVIAKHTREWRQERDEILAATELGRQQNRIRLANTPYPYYLAA